jgi:hypothetical protein
MKVTIEIDCEKARAIPSILGIIGAIIKRRYAGKYPPITEVVDAGSGRFGREDVAYTYKFTVGP